MANVKISQLTPKGANLASTDLLEISEFDGSGYVTKSITGQEIIDAVGGGAVTDVTGTAPISSSGGTTPDISMAPADTAHDGYLTSTDWNTFDGKQDTLVSGTNIKTLNGASLLGSGGLSVEPSITAGTTAQYFRGDKTFQTLDKTAVGLSNVDNTSDVNKPISTANQTALNAKQATLVSATNIKTINGSSVLGSGDLVIGGGSGLQGVHTLLPLASGQSTFAATTSQGLATTATALNRLYAVPFIPNQNITTSALYMNVTTLGVGVNCRILVYSDLNGLPNTKLYESANLDCSTIGVKTATTTFNFVAGTTYWLCIHASGICTISFINTSGLIPISINGVANANTHIFTSATFGSAPTTFGTPTITNGNAPFLGITKA